MKRTFTTDKVAPVGGPRRRRRNSNRLIAGTIFVAIVAGVGGGTAFAYANLKGRADRLQAAIVADIQAGQHELEAGRATLSQANSKRDASLTPQAITHFTSAKEQFIAARKLADNSRLVHVLEQIPAAGYFIYSRHTTIDALAEMGVALAEAGLELSDLDGKLIKPSESGQATGTLLKTLDQMRAGLLKVRADLDRAQRAAEQVDVSLLPMSQQATFVKARNAIATAEKGLAEFGRLVPVFKEILGGNGPRTYLIEQVNPAELRAGGGFIGTYSVLQADAGKLTLIRSGPASELAEPRPTPGQPGFIPQPGPLREVIPQISWSFLDSNLFPDFASNAKAAISFVQPRLGTKIDAVISIDYYTVVQMLALTGPLTVPGYGITVDANNFISELLPGDIAGTASHYAILSAAAGPLMERVTALPPDRWPALIGALNTLASERHLQVYFNNGPIEEEIARVGWSGDVNPTKSQDYMMEVESNYFGDKVNYFVTRRYTVLLTRSGGKLHHKVTVDLVNPMPAGISVHSVYKVNVRLYIGDKASSSSHNLKAVQYPNPSPPAGTQLIDGWVPEIYCCGAQGQAVFEYDTPWPSNASGSAEIYWQKQPGTLVDKVEVIWDAGYGRKYTVSGDLGQDRVIRLSPTGVTLSAGQPAQATLPTLTFG